MNRKAPFENLKNYVINGIPQEWDDFMHGMNEDGLLNTPNTAIIKEKGIVEYYNWELEKIETLGCNIGIQKKIDKHISIGKDLFEKEYNFLEPNSSSQHKYVNRIFNELNLLLSNQVLEIFSFTSWKIEELISDIRIYKNEDVIQQADLTKVVTDSVSLKIQPPIPIKTIIKRPFFIDLYKLLVKEALISEVQCTQEFFINAFLHGNGSIMFTGENQEVAMMFHTLGPIFSRKRVFKIIEESEMFLFKDSSIVTSKKLSSSLNKAKNKDSSLFESLVEPLQSIVELAVNN